MSKRAFHPDRGDLITLNFQPAAGREIDKRPLAIVLRAGMCLAVPLTSDLTPGPFWIPMPSGYLDVPNLILCDYVKSVDYRGDDKGVISRSQERATCPAKAADAMEKASDPFSAVKQFIAWRIISDVGLILGLILWFLGVVFLTIRLLKHSGLI